jgi:hypothetical protein
LDKRSAGDYLSAVTKSEHRFFADVAEILRAGRNTAYRAVNSAMVETYWRLLSSYRRGAAPDADARAPSPSGFIKDPYALEFLDVPEDLTGKATGKMMIYQPSI